MFGDLMIDFCAGVGLGMLLGFTAYGFKAMFRAFVIPSEESN